MNLKQSLSIVVLTLASSWAMADGGDIGVANYPIASKSTVSRQSVKSSVVAARSDGELRPTGESGDTPYAFTVASPSTVTRAEVKLETIQAAQNGGLTPAGEAYFERPAGENSPTVANGSAKKVLSSVSARLHSK